ncbi:uncharacterized protein EV422DRAFT_534802 [Fimicolochytrium jonesii]|uniref:uncharacterized protein n=1 Tax=Fimicolochytrium jonesii TaxID=1396493 RepID=UPI0022FEFBC7|nr:uncharacterized protein EV422DRAFT_534802 [Fimicolochytrium jonesii]KAI8819456.1 hypothetical protein EV422DRAFT_534802 [Fimicolochytrium jonesii]
MLASPCHTPSRPVFSGGNTYRKKRKPRARTLHAFRANCSLAPPQRPTRRPSRWRWRRYVTKLGASLDVSVDPDGLQRCANGRLVATQTGGGSLERLPVNPLSVFKDRNHHGDQISTCTRVSKTQSNPALPATSRARRAFSRGKQPDPNPNHQQHTHRALALMPAYGSARLRHLHMFSLTNRVGQGGTDCGWHSHGKRHRAVVARFGLSSPGL